MEISVAYVGKMIDYCSNIYLQYELDIERQQKDMSVRWPLPD